MSDWEFKEDDSDDGKWEPRLVKSKLQDVALVVLVAAARVVDAMLPTLFQLYARATQHYRRFINYWVTNIPTEINYVLLGLFLCLYGGSFPAVIATATAIQQSGQWGNLKLAIFAIIDQVKEAATILQEDKMVQALDKDHDGKVSLEEIAIAFQEQGKGLMMTAMPMILTKVDPVEMNKAIVSIWRVWCSVMITLQSVFARQIALGMQFGQSIFGTAKGRVTPVITKKNDTMDKKNYKVWSEYAVLIGCKIVGVLFAMFLAKYIGGLMSALQGGEIIAKAGVAYAKQCGIIISQDTDDLQSLLTYLVGGLGFYYQFKSGFQMNAVFQFILTPASVAETILGFFVYAPSAN